MNPVVNIPLKIQNLLMTNGVMSVKQLRHEFSGRSRSSLFRDLRKLDVISSFTHTGQYHALKRTAQFDENGLWFFQAIGFSQHGTLKNALGQVISNSRAGMTHKEVKMLFRIEVQKPLTDLVNTSAVTRQLLPSRVFVYLSADEKRTEEQFQQRLAIADRSLAIALPAESIRIEILVEVINAPERTLDEKVLGPLLRQRGVIIRDDEIAHVLAHYDIKKNGL